MIETGKVLWTLAGVVIGFIAGRVTKSCPLTVKADEPYPSATGILEQLAAGNQDAAQWLEFVTERASHGDREAVGWLADFGAVHAVYTAEPATTSG